MSKRGLVPAEETPLALPMPFERQPRDTPWGWDAFVLFLETAPEMTVTKFIESLPSNAQLNLANEPYENDWARRKMLYWDYVANLGNKMVAAESAKTGRSILKKLNKTVNAIYRKARRAVEGKDDTPPAILLGQLAAAAGVNQKVSAAAAGGLKFTMNITNDMRAPGTGGPQSMELGAGFHSPNTGE